MRVLVVDVGTGTQDILLFDSDRELENCFKLVMPSPTVAIADRIRVATHAARPVVLIGATMGGGPCHWAAMDHIRAGLPVFATPDAARTFDDDLDSVREMGIQLLSEDEARHQDGELVVLRDLWLDEILHTLRAFGAPADVDRLAVAVFDHGAAPPGYSDRIFRFDYLKQRLAERESLAAFAFRRDDVPERLTRLRAVGRTAPPDVPLLLMDTAPAAVLGALDDPHIAEHDPSIVVNVGNFHCLAFHLSRGRVAGLFEHHTGELTSLQLESFIMRLADGSLTNEEIFQTNGHGAAMRENVPSDGKSPFVAAIGPRRQMLREGRLAVYEAVPQGDMMLAGCFGLLRAYAELDEEVREAVERRMGSAPLSRRQSVSAEHPRHSEEDL